MAVTLNARGGVPLGSRRSAGNRANGKQRLRSLPLSHLIELWNLRVTRQFEKIAIGGEFTLQVSGSQVSNHITFFPDCAVPSCLITGAGRFDAATKMFEKIRFSGEFTIETSGCQVLYHFTLAPKTAVEYLTVPRGANTK
jgi:hypothetical protein